MADGQGPAVAVAASLLNDSDKLEGVMLGDIVDAWLEAGIDAPPRPLWRALKALDEAVKPSSWALKEGQLTDEKVPLSARRSLPGKWLGRDTYFRLPTDATALHDATEARAQNEQTIRVLKGWERLLSHPDLVDASGAPHDSGSAASIAHLHMDAAETLHALGRDDEALEHFDAGFLLSRTFPTDQVAIIAIGLNLNEAELLWKMGHKQSALKTVIRAEDMLGGNDVVACTASLSLARLAVLARDSGEAEMAAWALEKLSVRFGTPTRLRSIGSRQLNDWARDSAGLAADKWEEIRSEVPPAV